MKKILEICEKEALASEMKAERARSSSLDYEREYWSGQLDAYEYILSFIKRDLGEKGRHENYNNDK